MNTTILDNLKEKIKINLLKELKKKILSLKNNKNQNQFSTEDIEYLKKFNNPLDIYSEIYRLNKKINTIKTNQSYNKEMSHSLTDLSYQLNALKDDYSFFSTNFNGTYNFLEFYGEKLLFIKNKINSIDEEINYLNSKIIPFPQKKLQSLKIKKKSK